MKQFFNKVSFILLLSAAFTFGACVDSYKDYYDPDYQTSNPLEGISAPEDFDWKLMNSINATVRVNDGYNGMYYYLVEIFDANPVLSRSANVISRGLVKYGQPLITKITVPKSLEHVYIRQTTPTGLASVRLASTTTGTIDCDFGIAAKAAKRAVATRSTDWSIGDFQVPDVNDRTIFPTAKDNDAVELVGNTWMKPGVYEITSRTTGINLGVNTADPSYISKLYVTQDASVSYTNNGRRSIYILPNKKLTITGDLPISSADCFISIGEGAELIVNGKMTVDHNGKVYNLGKIDTKSFYHLKTSIIYNAGEFSVSDTGEKSMQVDVSALFYNDKKLEIKGGWYATAGATGTTVIYNSGSGTIEVAGTLVQNSAGNKLVNDGDIICGNYTSTGSAKTQNNGLMTVAGDTYLKSKTDIWHNNGTWITETMQVLAYNSNYVNTCKLIVNDKLTLNEGRLVNEAGAFVKTTDLAMRNTQVLMGAEAFFNVTNVASLWENRLIDNEGFYGTGTDRALLKMKKAIAGNDSPNLVHYGGTLQVACDDHPEETRGYDTLWTMDEVAEWASPENNTVEIPTTECNEGSGSNPNPPVDPDPDPIVDPFTYTYLFEDQWPLYGDYDMNDIVLKVEKITKTPNKSNLIEKVSFDFTLQAVGASKAIAAAIMLDQTNAAEVKSVSYSDKTPVTFNVNSSGVENGQSKAIIPLFDNAHFFLGRVGRGYINTEIGSAMNVPNPPTITVEIALASPVASTTLDVSNFNLFIITDVNTVAVDASSRKEIHVIGYSPTSKANTDLFGNNNDASSSSKYYVSKDNLAWGIVIPDAFRWPIEYKNIKNAYLGFSSWVTSGGDEETEWWKNPANPGFVF